MAAEKSVCEFIEECRFYKEFGARQSNVWRAIFNMYCNGQSRSLCDVYIKKQETGRFAASNIMPNGCPVSIVYQQLP